MIKMLPREELAEFFNLKDEWRKSEEYFNKIFLLGKER